MQRLRTLERGTNKLFLDTSHGLRVFLYTILNTLKGGKIHRYNAIRLNPDFSIFFFSHAFSGGRRRPGWFAYTPLVLVLQTNQIARFSTSRMCRLRFFCRLWPCGMLRQQIHASDVHTCAVYTNTTVTPKYLRTVMILRLIWHSYGTSGV